MMWSPRLPFWQWQLGSSPISRTLMPCLACAIFILVCVDGCGQRDSRGTWLYDAMGHAYFFLGDYEKAIEVSNKGLHQDPSVFGALVTLACAYTQLDREHEAKNTMWTNCFVTFHAIR